MSSMEIVSILKRREVAGEMSLSGDEQLASSIAQTSGLDLYPRSLFASRGCIYFLAKRGPEKFLAIIFLEASPPKAEFTGVERTLALQGEKVSLKECPLTHKNALSLREALPHLKPRPIGTAGAVGLGDRLGLATPGHIRATGKGCLVPLFAQQSAREMTRTERSPEQVMDEATWGIFQEGYRGPFGSDADHLKTAEQIDACVKAGFTMFTIDPGDYVDNEADSVEGGLLRSKFDELPWRDLETTARDCQRTYCGRDFKMEGGAVIRFTEEDLMRAAAKYGRAVAQTLKLYRHLLSRMGKAPFELEMSVDETASPTTVPEHFFVASELKRLRVQWVSLAPRFVGEFEKGVDYKGDLAFFERSVEGHIAVARTLGPYKLGIHSGSDKFRIYPVLARKAGGLLHLKTAGTSYLEALRVIARREGGLFREILNFACERFPQDRATYNVSADLEAVRARLEEERFSDALDDFNCRQVLHVTYGSVLTSKDASGEYIFRRRLLAAIRKNEELYYSALEEHLGRHIAALAGKP